jgi:hypothetical protein
MPGHAVLPVWLGMDCSAIMYHGQFAPVLGQIASANVSSPRAPHCGVQEACTGFGNGFGSGVHRAQRGAPLSHPYSVQAALQPLEPKTAALI